MKRSKVIIGTSLITMIMLSGCVKNTQGIFNDQEASKSIKETVKYTSESLLENLTEKEKKEFYEAIKMQIKYLVLDGENLQKKGYYNEAKKVFELANYYNEKNIVSSKKFNELDEIIQQKRLIYYQKSFAASENKDTIGMLMALNILMKIDPSYKNGKMIFEEIKKDPVIIEFLKLKKERLQVLLENNIDTTLSLSDLAKSVEDLAMYNHLDPLVKKAQKRLRYKKYPYLDEALSLYNDRDYLVAKEKFEVILKIYGTDVTSSKYLSKINTYYQREKNKKIVKKENSKLLSLYQKKEYKVAMKQAQVILNRDSNNKIARKVLEDSIDALGLIDEEKLLNFFNNREYKLAIKQAQVMLEKNMNNMKAKQILDDSKYALYVMVPNMIKEGKKLYNSQELKKALEVFNKVITIDDENEEGKLFYKKITAQLKTLEGLEN